MMLIGRVSTLLRLSPDQRLKWPCAGVASLSSPSRRPLKQCTTDRAYRKLSRSASESDKEPPPSPSENEGKPAADATGVATEVAAPPSNAELLIPKDVIERLKYSVFGFDTFWVTSVEDYPPEGVVFKGNMRGKDPAAAYKKMADRMKAELGDKFQLLLVRDDNDQPSAVVLPASMGQQTGLDKETEVYVSVLLGLISVVTSLNTSGLALVDAVLTPWAVTLTQQDFIDVLPTFIAFWTVLGVHEWGHIVAARERGMQLQLPVFIPASFGLLGSFGAVTRLRGLAPSRAALLDVASRGPAYGAAVAAAMTTAGLVLTSLGTGSVPVDPEAFGDSLIVGLAAQAFLGDMLAAPVIPVHPLLVAGWAGLIVSALSVIPAGDLDGGRIAAALWGRRPASLLSLATIAAMAVSSLASPLAFFWVALVLILQRGPVSPCSEEFSEPGDQSQITLGAGLLLLPLLVLVPFPFELAEALSEMGNPSLTPPLL